MKVIKKIFISILLIGFIGLICYLFYLKSTYIDRESNGLKYKTYELINEDGSISKIILNEKTIIFDGMEFLEMYNVAAMNKLAKNNGLQFNTLSQEEKDNLIEIEVKDMIYKNILQRNKEYEYTYDSKTNIISLKLDEYVFTISFTDESFVKFVKTMKKPKLTLYGKDFY